MYFRKGSGVPAWASNRADARAYAVAQCYVPARRACLCPACAVTQRLRVHGGRLLSQPPAELQTESVLACQGRGAFGVIDKLHGQLIRLGAVGQAGSDHLAKHGLGAQFQPAASAAIVLIAHGVNPLHG